MYVFFIFPPSKDSFYYISIFNEIKIAITKLKYRGIQKMECIPHYRTVN